MVPAGTANDLAHLVGQHGIPTRDAMAMASWERKDLDAIDVNGVRFYSAGGLGWVADVAATANRWRSGTWLRRWLLARLGHLLYTIACVDGDFDESEQALLSMIAQRMELTQEEFDACLPTAAFSLDDVRITPPDDDEVRVQWLRNLIMMVAADGVLQATEYQTCLFFASQLGFEPNIVDDVLMSMAQ